MKSKLTFLIALAIIDVIEAMNPKLIHGIFEKDILRKLSVLHDGNNLIEN